MSKYAASTEVSSTRSRDEIERTLQRYGADQFLYGWRDEGAVVGFRMAGRHIQLIVPLPKRDDKQFTEYVSRGKLWARSEDVAAKLYEQAVRQKWRALALVIKAKLEAVDAGISEFESEFLANIVLPTGITAGAWLRPQVAEAYRVGKMPPMLPMLPAPSNGDGE
jgi:hypothetical protein